MAVRLVIEIDGSQHGVDKHLTYDNTRTRWLETEGYQVIRFWNNEVFENIQGVLYTIQERLYGSRDAEPKPLKHTRRSRVSSPLHPTPARS
ncbi:MAG: hypothetical protein QOF19_1661, partial [Alphaproteobacteria bacterium]|nr:hypothetical protein [Alphaproteobacteria bacterium]